MNNTSLTHVGILGMRWGRRKAHTTDGSGESQSKVSMDSPDHARSRKLRTKKLNEMSNDEIRDLTTRLELEKKYKDLTQKQMSQGKKAFEEMMMSSAKTVATPYVTKFMGKGVEELVKAIGSGK